MNIYFNIVGNTETLITSKKETDANFEYNQNEGPSIQSMSICNVHSSNDVTVNLYIEEVTFAQNNNYNNSDYRLIVPKREDVDILPGEEADFINQFDSTPGVDTTETYYILKNIIIPFGVTLYLNQSDLYYDDSRFSLKIVLNAEDSAVDLIIK